MAFSAVSMTPVRLARATIRRTGHVASLCIYGVGCDASYGEDFMKLWILLLGVLSAAASAQTKGKEVIDYQVKGSKAPEVRTVINKDTGRVDTYQGTGRDSTGRVTGAPAQRAHSVTSPSGQTTYHRSTVGQVITNSGAHVPRGGGAAVPSGDIRGGGSAPGGGGGQPPYKR
jgi:hypothetical protein